MTFATSKLHMHIRHTLQLLCDMHDHGRTELRFMLLSAAESHTVFIGPRRLFCAEDGTFIPADVRHRAVRLNPDGDLPEFRVVLQDLSRLSEFRAGDLDDRTVRLCPTHSQDIASARCNSAYVTWAKKLHSFLSEFELALPRRFEYEFLEPTRQGIAVEFRESSLGRSFAPALYFEPPPGGVLHATLPRAEVDESIKVAQARDPGGPQLLWPVRTGPTWDQIVDARHDARG